MEFELTTARRQLHIAVTLITVILLTTVPSFVLGYPNDSGKLPCDAVNSALLSLWQLNYSCLLLLLLLLGQHFLILTLPPSPLTLHLLHSPECTVQFERHPVCSQLTSTQVSVRHLRKVLHDKGFCYIEKSSLFSSSLFILLSCPLLECFSMQMTL